MLPDPATAPALKTVIATRFGVAGFPVGAAIEADSTTGAAATLLKKHFSAITAENAMKPDTVWPNAAGSNPPMPAATPNFVPADALVTFATNNGIEVRAHTLLWHQTVPTWLITGNKSTPDNYRADVQQHIAVDVHRAARLATSAVEAVSLAQASVDLAAKQRELAIYRFERGLADNLDVIDAENNMFLAESGLVAADIDRALALVGVQRAAGALDPGRFLQ